MFLNWFSDDDCGQYQASAYKLTIDHIGSSLVNLRYADEVIRQHLHEWLRFCIHLEVKGISSLPTANSDLVQNYVSERIAGLSASRARFVRATVRIFLEADEKGEFRRRINSPPSTPSWFNQILTQYLQFVRVHRGLSEKTERKYRQKLSAFAYFLEGCGIGQLGAITPQHVREFYENAEGVPRRSYGSTLRAFFNWAAAQGWLSKSLGDTVPRPRQYRHMGLPDVLNHSELERLLNAIDRSTPLGRRDYAILLLAARYGLRPSDIRQLALDDIDWREDRIDLRQVKTGRSLALPLLPEVAQALSAYLSNGRPTSTNRVIFLRHCAPYEPFAKENNLNAIMRKALRLAGLHDRSGRRGLYLLRHSLATQLLASGRPLKTISDLLGHASTHTTYVYTKVDLVGLRAVTISEGEVNQ
ncbi:MAG TPA: site-specific integrase [Blastocatellia bacterium]|nr:site-specific integrase [Blastocatellia bacterium]